MAKTFSAVTNTNTFETWLDQTNVMLAEFANVVTVAGDAPNGNAVVNGTISAQTYFVNTAISGGQIGTAANLNITSALVVSNSANLQQVVEFGGNTTFNANVTLAAANVNLGAIANLYITASPDGVQDYLAVNATTGQIFLQTISERIGLDDLTDVVANTTVTSNSVLAWDTAAGNAQFKTFEDVLDEAFANGYSNIRLGSEFSDGSISKPSAANVASIAIGGESCWAEGNVSIALGYGAKTESGATGGVSIGNNTRVWGNGVYGIAIGTLASASQDRAIAMGVQSSAYGANSIMIGGSGSANSSSVAIGRDADAQGPRSVSIGHRANSVGTAEYSVAIGANTNCQSNTTVAIGYSANSSGNSSIAIGYSSVANNLSSVALGFAAKAYQYKSVAIGETAISNGYSSIALGEGANTTNSYTIAIGTDARAANDGAIAIGYLANATANYSMALGFNTDASVANTIVLGCNTSFFVNIPSLVSSNVVPSANQTHDLGSTTARWKDVYTRSVNATIINSAGLNISGNSTLTGSAFVTGNLVVDSTTFVANASSGRIGIGMTDPDAKLEVDGSVLVSGDVTTGYSSDERLKDNITTIEDAHGILNQIRGVNFTWSGQVENGIGSHLAPHKGDDVGVIAQEVKAALPSAVREVPTDEKWLLVEYHKLVPVLIEAVKDLNNRVKELESGNS